MTKQVTNKKNKTVPAAKTVAIKKKEPTPKPEPLTKKAPPKAEVAAKAAKVLRVKAVANNQKPKRVKAAGKPEAAVPKKPKNLQKRYEFLEKHLKNHDDYFRLNFSADLLLELFNVLMKEEKVSQAEIEKFVYGVYQNRSIKDIFDHFGVKQN